jgi:hypothetical protein
MEGAQVSGSGGASRSAVRLGGGLADAEIDSVVFDSGLDGTPDAGNNRNVGDEDRWLGLDEHERRILSAMNMNNMGALE